MKNPTKLQTVRIGHRHGKGPSVPARISINC